MNRQRYLNSRKSGHACRTLCPLWPRRICPAGTVLEAIPRLRLAGEYHVTCSPYWSMLLTPVPHHSQPRGCTNPCWSARQEPAQKIRGKHQHSAIPSNESSRLALEQFFQCYVFRLSHIRHILTEQSILEWRWN